MGKYINVGDHIEKIDNHSLVGCRHYEVAKMLKEIPKGTTFIIRVVEPLQAGFSNIGPRSNPGTTKKAFGSGKETLRLRANGPACVEQQPDSMVEAATEKINGLLESFMGINDAELGKFLRFELLPVSLSAKCSPLITKLLVVTMPLYLQPLRYGKWVRAKPTRWTLPKPSTIQTWKRSDSPTISFSNCGEPSRTPKPAA